ncbi:hypothetical protein ACFYKX_11520 [Cytobacillus sp. FJAT-54145]|uniref:Uncharacterized protein n=1 Tax=Cytobacillus spartinae TaxID=3299023 RepID=A0ABW6KD91_9BACI
MKPKSFEEVVKSYIGQTIQTVYGPSLVVGIIEEDGEKLIHLKEFGEEDYTIECTEEKWNALTK